MSCFKVAFLLPTCCWKLMWIIMIFRREIFRWEIFCREIFRREIFRREIFCREIFCKEISQQQIFGQEISCQEIILLINHSFKNSDPVLHNFLCLVFLLKLIGDVSSIKSIKYHLAIRHLADTWLTQMHANSTSTCCFLTPLNLKYDILIGQLLWYFCSCNFIFNETAKKILWVVNSLYWLLNVWCGKLNAISCPLQI